MQIQDQTITTILEGYKSKKFSVSDVVLAYLDRIEKIDPDLNSFITVTKAEALRKAKEMDSKTSEISTMPLFGIPIALKDMYITKGIRTTAASNVLKDYIPQYDASVVKKYKDAGAIILGKLNHDAWAHGSSGENSDFGATKNPWNKDFVPGGSSSGSGVSVAAGLAPVASGTDTGGSIRQPASFTNTVGLKPTYGRVSRNGIIAMASSLDSIGHFTKTVSDSAQVLQVTAGQDLLDATLTPKDVPNYLENLRQGIKGMKLGIPKEFVEKGLQPEVKQVFEKSVKEFEKLGAEIIEVSLPHTEYGIAIYYIIQTAEVSSNLARYDGVRYGNDRTAFGEEAKRRIMLGTYVLSAGYYDAYYKKAMQVRTLVKKDFEKVFGQVDALIAPVAPSLPWKLGEKVSDPLSMYLEDALTVTINMAGVPAISVPAGFSHSTSSGEAGKLPVGLQIIGPHFSEDKLFQIGYAFEQETNYWKEAPKL
ncbi:MAG TPA: Asp-tRNA(Asn)/Glu-tRNA(Gln) amidotransferase subunit GatA [Candidatus Levybacteria bacterium]|nr:Asp-tRNA(Asn)/Glu-tRNA(Gln) amidotransferase subunit GatA [Candidatus Levybacteria bacterium]